MQIKVGDILHCNRDYKVKNYSLGLESGELYYVGYIDHKDHTLELRHKDDMHCIDEDEYKHTWIHYGENIVLDTIFGFVDDYFESKIERAKRIIKER